MSENSNDQKLIRFILASEEVISKDGINEVRHYFEHGEYEMSFEGLVIELMSDRKYPNNFDFKDWKELAIYYRLDKESVFDGDFWMKFLKWGENFIYSKK